jgi:GxxExxY protein
MKEAVKTKKTIEELNIIADRVVDAIFSVHRTMGPGFNESIYESCLKEEFNLRGINYQSQMEIPVTYKGKKLDKFFKLDILAEDEIIVELKSVSELLPVHKAQLLSYLKLTGKRIGYVANFNVALMKEGIRRVRLDDASGFNSTYP